MSQKTPSDIGLEDIIREVNERQLRKSNLIFYGFDELPQHTPASERKIKDRTLVTDFLAFLEITGDDTVTDLDCFRLGKYDVNRSRPRPIKIHFKDEQQAKKILQTVRTKTAQIQNDRQLKNVGVSIDKNPTTIIVPTVSQK